MVELIRRLVKLRIERAWAAFAKLKSIPRSPTFKFTIRLCKAECISKLLYGCQPWILTIALIEKLDIFTKTCFRIMLDNKQSWYHVKNKRIYHVTLRETIRERHLKFTGICTHIPTRSSFFVVSKKKRPLDRFMRWAHHHHFVMFIYLLLLNKNFIWTIKYIN